MENWAWVLLCLWLGMLLSSVLSLKRTLRVAKALRSVCFYQGFNLELNETAPVTVKLTFTQAAKRLVPAIGAFSYSDLQFDLPPSLRFLELQVFLSILLLSFSISEEISPAISGFTASNTVIEAVLCSALGLVMMLGMEWVFIGNINRRNRRRKETVYGTSQEQRCGEVVTRSQQEETVERQELTFRNPHLPAVSDTAKGHKFPMSLEVTLVGVLFILTFAVLWGLYVLPEISSLAVLTQWTCGIIVDFCVRLALGGVLTYTDALPDYHRRYIRLEGIEWEDLQRFIQKPLNEELAEGDSEPCPPNTTLTEETQRHWTGLNPSFKPQIPLLHFRHSGSQISTSAAGVSEAAKHQETCRQMEADLDPAFPPLTPIQRITEAAEPCPPLASLYEVPETIDEFPIPPEAERFSDIGISPYMTQNSMTLKPTAQTTQPSELTKAIYGYKPALFGKGTALQTVKKQKKTKRNRQQLESIISENEEEREAEGRRKPLSYANSQAKRGPNHPNMPISPNLKPPNSHHFEPEIVVSSDEKNPCFKPGKPMPPSSCDPDIFPHPDSPTAADESPISFLTSEKTTSRDMPHHPLHPSRSDDMPDLSSSSIRGTELMDILQEGEDTEIRGDLTNPHKQVIRLGRARSHARLPPLHNSGSPYEELLWRMMKDDEAPTAHRPMPVGYRRSSRMKNILASYEGSERGKALSRHGSLSPLQRPSFRTMSRRQSAKAL